MKITARAKLPMIVILGLLVTVCVIFIFFRMYRDDIKALKGFMTSYEGFDKAISSYAGGGGFDALGRAGEAMIELQGRSSLRLSSLIRNDAGLMEQARDVADLARREFEGLKAYGTLARNGTSGPDDLARKNALATEYAAIRDKRIASYVRFQEFAGNR
jgi:hypothetical protein